MHDAPLRVELAEHGVGQAVALHPEPQLQLVGRDVDEIDGEVVARAGVHAGAALAGVYPAEVLLDQQVALLGQKRLEPIEQLLVLCTAHRRVIRIVDLTQGEAAVEIRLSLLDLDAQAVQLVDDGEVAFDVLRPHRVRPLEHHVFEEMRDAGDPGALVYGAHLGDPAGRHVRVAGSRDEQQRQAVVELMLDDIHLLRRRGNGQNEQGGQYRNDQ